MVAALSGQLWLHVRGLSADDEAKGIVSGGGQSPGEVWRTCKVEDDKRLGNGGTSTNWECGQESGLVIIIVDLGLDFGLE